MSTFKCKMCGGTLEIEPNETIATCEYCGTQQTLPKLDDERRANLYDRANHFRRNNEFDKAMGIYEKILNEDNTDAEAYWSLVLCRYGIEYVEDPASHKRVPTVNRAQFTSIYDDDNYKSALQYADSLQRSIYEAEAATINEIQKGILEISSKEEPFDVFICYKESDANGRRTPDSVLATELYHELTNEGFKVFFSRITLEDKLGTAYEPYIFAALNSAKVMVVLGTKPEYFNAVWVKNEWSRYLALIKAGQKKILIPAYKDMDPYDLPEEFSHLQAQDMTKLGFMQDLIRGIKKILYVDKPKTTVVKETVVTEASAANVAPLLKRAFMFLEDENWNEADAYCEKVLDIEPENAQAYLGKLLAERKITKPENLKNDSELFSFSANYKKAMRFGDDELKAKLQSALDSIQTRKKQEKLDAEYQKAVDLMEKNLGRESIEAADQLKNAGEQFKALGDYQDSKERSTKCFNQEKECRYNCASRQFETARYKKEQHEFEEAAKLFATIPGYKDADELVHKCQKEGVCAAAMSKMNGFSIETYDEAIKLLEDVRGYYDEWCNADDLLETCHNKKTEILHSQEEERLELQRREQQRKAEAEIAARKRKKLVLIIAAAVVLFASVGSVINFIIIPNNKYKNAVALMDSGNYPQALAVLKDLGEYKDSDNLIRTCRSVITDMVRKGKSKSSISIYAYHTVALRSDGTVIAVGSNNHGQCDVGDWTDIIAVSAGLSHTVGLRSDGTVVAIGNNESGQCNVGNWKDIIAISAGESFTIGLRSDGTVVATGSNSFKQCNVADWTDIVAISAGTSHTVGLRSDGTVVAAGEDYDDACNVRSWKNIVAVSAGLSHTVGLKSDGTVVAVGGTDIKAFDDGQCNVSDWKDIIAVSAGAGYTMGLRSDGTVVAVGNNQDGRSDVNDWEDIVEISAGMYNTVGLRADGTVVAVGLSKYGVCDVGEWKNIRLPWEE